MRKHGLGGAVLEAVREDRERGFTKHGRCPRSEHRPAMRRILSMTFLVAALVAALAASPPPMAHAAPASAPAGACGTPVTLPPDLARVLRPAPSDEPTAPQRCEPPRFGERSPAEGEGGGNRSAPPPTPGATPVPTAPLVPRAVVGPYLEDEVLAAIRGGAREAQALAARLNLTVISVRASTLLGGAIVRFGIPDGRPVPLVLAELARSGAATELAPNHLYRLQAPPRSAASSALGFAFKQIRLDRLAGRLRGRGVRVAIIDSAVDARHPAIAAAIVDRFDALPDWPVRERSHGTAIAGLIAGRDPSPGVAPAAELLSARAFDIPPGQRDNPKAKAGSHTAALLAALDWAVDKGAQVVNMSFAGPRNPLFARALGAASARGVVLVAAAGNEGPRAPYAYPGAEPMVLAITATDHRNRIYRNANRGPYIFAAAPGVDVLAPAPGGGSGLVTGTSFAAAVLSGVAALLIERYRDLPPERLAAAIAKSARDLGPPGRDPVFGAGLANAAAAAGLE